MRSSPVFCVVASLVLPSLAQFPSPLSGISTVQSKLQPGVDISYKQTYICETTPGVKSYSGYIHLPSSVLREDVGNYNISTFFWFFEARNNPTTAPLAIYLNGGPGEPTTYAVASSENGPCYANIDGNSTTSNPWSFNNHVNMLYIDQPVQAGFSYNSLINGTFNLISGKVTPTDFSKGLPAQNETFGVGVFANQSKSTTTNNTVTSAKAMWHFAEHWFSQFPEYKPKNNRISVWGNSYGGYWVPAVAAYFDKQIKSTKSHPRLHQLQVDTIGITNGCIDELIGGPVYPQYAHNNTYGLQLFSDSRYKEAMHNFTKPEGCRDLIEQCRTLGELSDPLWIGNNLTVNTACTLATDYCYAYVLGDLNTAVNRSNFDIAVKIPDPCPLYLPIQYYFNQPWVQQALGVPLNWTYGSNVILDVFGLDPTGLIIGTGDAARKDISDFEYVLNNNIKVAMVFGDRDYRCNWLGGEATALSAKYPHADKFKAAGYEKITTNSTYDGGVVKQYGKFSFSRVFEAGHSVSAYQPETVYRIFMRSMFDRDIATGTKSILGTNYSSTGPPSSFRIKNVLPPAPSTCVVAGQYLNVTLGLP